MSFAREVGKFSAKTEGLTNKQIRFLCLNLFKDVIQGTPVDTGRARANWQASIGSPVTGVLEKADKDGGATTKKGLKAVQQSPNNVFYITNNLPYIYRLEFEGWSDQAPSGWVRTAVERTKQIAARMPRG